MYCYLAVRLFILFNGFWMHTKGGRVSSQLYETYAVQLQQTDTLAYPVIYVNTYEFQYNNGDTEKFCL